MPAPIPTIDELVADWTATHGKDWKAVNHGPMDRTVMNRLKAAGRMQEAIRKIPMTPQQMRDFPGETHFDSPYVRLIDPAPTP